MAMTLITTNTESNATTSDFTSGIDSTYKLYIFKFIDINPATDAAEFTFQANAAGGSGFNETITSTVIKAEANEAGSSASLGMESGEDQAQGTDYQNLALNVGNGADESCAGTLWLFNPSNTTYVKHFYSRIHALHKDNYAMDNLVAGYFNITAAIDEISFKMDSGNFDGTIKMYGVG